MTGVKSLFTFLLGESRITPTVDFRPDFREEKMKTTKSSRRATDHRALVLESVATSPTPATLDSIAADCHGADPSYTRKLVAAMVWWLVRVGLLGRTGDSYFLTKAGLEWLTTGRFDRALPAPHTRPGARRKKPKS